MAVKMSKSVKVMELVHAEGDTACFHQEEVPQVQVYLSKQDFEDFGSPEVITVTVQPGDLLND